MAVHAPHGSLVGFRKLDHLVYLYRPTTTVETLNTSTDGKQDPQLIVLCSWMGADLKHIAKYTQNYQTLFPRAAILLVASHVRDTFASARAQRSRMLVAGRVVASFQTGHSDDNKASTPTLLHCMSNGGGIAAAHLTAVLRHELHLRGQLYSTMIMECMPGRGDIERGVTAVSMSLPRSPVVRWIARWLLRMVMYTMRLVFVTLLRREEMMQRLRRQFNEPTMISVPTPRLYLYSRADQLIDYREVHEHAQMARQQGYAVTEEVFDTAAHCALMPTDGPRYWAAISDMWNAADTNRSAAAKP